MGRWKISQTRHFPDYKIRYRAAQRRGELSWVHPAVWTLGGQGMMAALCLPLTGTPLSTADRRGTGAVFVDTALETLSECNKRLGDKAKAQRPGTDHWYTILPWRVNQTPVTAT